MLCNNCIFLVFCFYILYIAPFVGEHSFPDQCGIADNIKGYGTHQPHDHLNIYKGT